MAPSPLHVLILAGGESTRIRTGGPKALLPLCGRPLLEHIFAATEGLEVASRTLVLGPRHREPIEAWLEKAGHEDWQVVIQEQARGTGDAVRCALEVLPEEGRLLILCGDTPLLEQETLALLSEHENAMLTALVEDPTGLGRILRDEEQALQGIVEEADASEEQRSIQEINSGVFSLAIAPLRKALAGVDSDNAQGEIYLTDAAVAVLMERNGATVCLEDDGEQVFGVNDLSQFANASLLLRERILSDHLAAGVLIDDPASTYIEAGVEIAPGAHLMPFCVIRRGVRIGSGASVGPFAHLRPGTVLEQGAAIGNFVEAKNAHLGAGAKSKHLTYLGDVEIGAGANIGCGTITANYDGKHKHRTVIGERAFVGSGSILVAPVTIGAGATTGAGSVVTAKHDVAPGETVIGVPAKPFSSKPRS